MILSDLLQKVASSATTPIMISPLTMYRKAQKPKKLSLQSFGAMFGVNKTTVRYWERRGVPPERVLEIEKVTGIPREQLRPDVFGAAQ